MKIEEGKRYKRRDGAVVGPVVRASNLSVAGGFPFKCAGETYTESGTWSHDDWSSYDLIEEVPDLPAKPSGPVRTVTRKEIVPGTYGPFDALEVMHHGKDGKIYVEIDGTVLYDASEIREFARLLNEIADAMEDQP